MTGPGEDGNIGSDVETGSFGNPKAVEAVETFDSQQIKNIGFDISNRVSDQLSLFEDYEERQWVEDADKKSRVLGSIFDRVTQLTTVGGAPFAMNVGGVSETPDHIKEPGNVSDFKKAKGNRALEEFMDSANKSYNLFHLDRNLSKQELEDRIAILSELYQMYRDANADERMYIEEAINRMFGVPSITHGVAGYLAHLDALETTHKSEGAENKNLIFVPHENKSLMFETHRGKPQVLKVSKGRHDIDFTSMLKLMMNMHVLMLRLNKDVKTPQDQTVKIRLVADDVTIYKDQDTNYKRIIKQPYAQGTPVGQISGDLKQSPEFRDAWVTFLREIESMRETDGVVLDMTNSGAPFPKNRMHHRGNVADTENIFVHREEDGSWLFSIIDPDVFDVVPGEHKFDPQEHANLGKKVTSALVGLMNKGRDTTTLGWQDRYMQEELGKDSSDSSDS